MKTFSDPVPSFYYHPKRGRGTVSHSHLRLNFGFTLVPDASLKAQIEGIWYQFPTAGCGHCHTPTGYLCAPLWQCGRAAARGPSSLPEDLCGEDRIGDSSRLELPMSCSLNAPDLEAAFLRYLKLFDFFNGFLFPLEHINNFVLGLRLTPGTFRMFSVSEATLYLARRLPVKFK